MQFTAIMKAACANIVRPDRPRCGTTIHVLKHVESITQHRDRPCWSWHLGAVRFGQGAEVNLYKASQHGEEKPLARVDPRAGRSASYSQSEFDKGGEPLPLHDRPEMTACVEQ